MTRAHALKLVLSITGLLFVATCYPLVITLRHAQHSDDIVPMFLSLYLALGVFLLIAVRNPPAYRSVILFAAWSSFAHAFVMLVQAYEGARDRPMLLGMSAVLIAIGMPLIALAPVGVQRLRGEPASSPPARATAPGASRQGQASGM